MFDHISLFRAKTSAKKHVNNLLAVVTPTPHESDTLRMILCVLSLYDCATASLRLDDKSAINRVTFSPKHLIASDELKLPLYIGMYTSRHVLILILFTALEKRPLTGTTGMKIISISMAKDGLLFKCSVPTEPTHNVLLLISNFSRINNSTCRFSGVFHGIFAFIWILFIALEDLRSR